MKLHLPLFLRKSLLVCLSAVAACTVGSASAWAEPQNLTFGDSSLTWDAQGDSFVNEAGEAAAFAEGDNVSFTGESIVTLGLDITAGTLDIAAGADVTIDLGNYTLNADTISLSGTLNVGDSLSIASGSTLAVQNDAAVLDSALVLGEKSGLAVDAAASLNNNTLTLQGGSNLILTAAGDGKTYTLFTGASGLVDAEGNAITLDSTNNAIANYFDTTRPGTGFWAGATLVLNDGALQLVRHNETVKEAVTITTRRTSGADYQYYAGVAFENIEYAAVDSDAYGGAIDGGSSAITLSNNGSVTFSGNSASSTASYTYGGAISANGGSTTLSNNGSVTFSGNTASSLNDKAYGGAIDGGSSSTITLSNNGSVSFSGNTASGRYAYGGAIDGEYNSSIMLNNNGSVTFSGNTVSASDHARGGAIYASGNLSIRNNDSVEFYQNVEVENGTYRLRSIYSGGYRDVSLSAAAGKSITFRDAVYVDWSSTFKLNEVYEGKAQQGDIVFTGATTADDLRTVKGEVDGTEEEIRLSRTSEVNTLTELYGGRLRVEEGAIYQGPGITAMEGSAATVRVQNATLSHSGFDLTFNAGTTLELSGNNTIAGSVQMLGGSSMVFDNTHGNGGTDIGGSIVFDDNVSLVLGNQTYGTNEVLLYVSDNVSGWDTVSLKAQGNSYAPDSFTWVGKLLVLNYDESSFNRYFNGVVNEHKRLEGAVIRHHYESVSFTDNTASVYGGAIYGDTISLCDNGSVSFIRNESAWAGGAICGSKISLCDNSSVEFSENTAYHVGAILCFGDVDLSNNGSVTFARNTSTDTGVSGAIQGGGDGTILLSNNGSVEFIGNTASSSAYAAQGGAICGALSGTITLSDNGSVIFRGNSASSSASTAQGGAIYTYDNLSICNNVSVLFEKNAEVENGTYRLRSIYAGGSDAVISLSAAAGKSIEFRDSVYISSESTVNLNADYTDPDGNIIKQQGDILFTGATTVDDLYEVKGNVAGTAEEIRLSRTTGVNAMTNLYGGRLRVEDGAIYQGCGITAYEGSEATVRVKDATLAHDGYELTFNAGTTLELEGSNSITGNVQMFAGSTVRLKDATLKHEGYDLTFNSGTTLELEGTNTITGNVQLLEGSTVRLKNATLSGNEIPVTFERERTLEMVGVNSITGDVQMLEGSSLRFIYDDAASGVKLILNDSLTLKAGSELQPEGAVDKVTLLGDGTLRMEGSADFSAFSLGNTWTGTVSLADITTEADLKMTTIGRAGSTIELENVKGYTGVKNGTVAANLVLNKSTAADGTEQAAFLVSNGYSSTTEGYVMTTFSGAVSGEGKMVFNRSLNDTHTGLKFTGNVAGWTGAFEMQGGKTFNLEFSGNATEIKADIRDVSSGGTLNLVLGADAAMTLSGAINTDSLIVSNAAGASFCNTVSTGTLSAAGSAVTFGAAATVSGDMSATAVVLNQGGSLDVGGALSAGQVTLKELSTTAPTLTVGSFVAGDTIFTLDVDALNALNLGHGQSVVIARADTAIGSDFSAWLAEGSTSLDAAVYRYDLSVSGSDVMVSMDYANWGTRIWYGNAWVGKESWKEYMTAGHDAVNGVETVNLGGREISDVEVLFLAPEDSSSTTVLSNGSIEAACTEIVEGNLTIAEDASLDSDELIAAGHDILLQGELIVNNGSIGTLSGTTGTLVIGGEVSVDSNVTLGILDNSGTLDIGSHKLNVAAVVSNGGNVTAGEVVVHNRYGNPAEFDTLVADKVTVTNTSSKYPDYLSVGGGSVIGELVADKLEVREGTATLGSTAKQTEQELQSIALQKGADLVLQGQTSLSVTDSVAMTAGSEVQIQSGSTLQNGAIALSAAPGTAAAQLSSKAGGDLVMMQQAGGLCIQDVLMMNTCISAAEGTEVMLSGVEGSENVHLLGGADFSLTFADNKADVGMAVIENSSPVTGITLSAGSTLTLVMDPSNNLFADYSLIINMTGFEYEGGNLAAAGGITELNAAGIYLGGWLGQLLADQGVAQESAGALEAPVVTGDSVPSISYTYSTENNVGMVISISGLSVPEPTTTTLSLLALTVLAARRRRK